MSDVQLFINGVWREGSEGGTGAFLNPAMEEPIGTVAYASAEDVDEAIRAAETALPVWRNTALDRRATILRLAGEVIYQRLENEARQLTLEQGKTLRESRAEFDRVVETFSWHADATLRLGETRSASVRPQPIGIVGAFTPWNYPAVIVARKLGAALAAGCSVILKAAEETPSAAAQVVAALQEAGLPRGVVNLVFGQPSAISEQVLGAATVRAFSFTGSTSVGKRLAERAARGLKRCVLELGGHAPVLVFEDADLDAAVAAIAAYKFECSGQSCNAPSRIYVQESLYRRFVFDFTAKAESLRTGDGRDASTDMGPMANSRRLAAMERLTEETLASGATHATGGRRLSGPGYFWPPTVFTNVPDSASIMTEEPFGPIVPVLSFSTFDEAIARANASPYGLAAYVFTGSERTAEMAALALEAGSVGINNLQGVPPDQGIAGIKESGYGYEGGQLGIEAFLNLKVVRRYNS